MVNNLINFHICPRSVSKNNTASQHYCSHHKRSHFFHVISQCPPRSS